MKIMRTPKRFSVISIAVCFEITSCSLLPMADNANRANVGVGSFRLEAAYRAPNITSLCFVAKASGRSEQRRLTLRIPMPDGVWRLPESLNTSLLKWAPEKVDVTGGKCLAEGKPMKILDVEQGQKTELPTGIDEAIYVTYQENIVTGLGYVSTKPFFGEHHSYMVDLTMFAKQIDEKGVTASLASAAKVAGSVGTVIGYVVVGVLVIPVILAYGYACGQPGMSCNSQSTP